MNEKNELHNRNLHIGGLLNEEKVDIEDSKVDIENEKVDIQEQKVDIESVLSEKGSDFSVKTTVHIHRLCENNYIRQNISNNLLKELKSSHHYEDTHRRALTIPEQELFLDFLSDESSQYYHWFPIFTVMVGTGMRVGEVM